MRYLNLSPSDFNFLLSECPKCFYYKVHGILARPRMPFPGVFNMIDSAMQKKLIGATDLKEMVEGPWVAGVYTDANQTVKSQPIVIDDVDDVAIIINGRFDLFKTMDGGGYGITDAKCSKVKDSLVDTYKWQLHAYDECVMNPAEGKFSLRPIEELGLLVFEPDGFVVKTTNCGIKGKMTWMDIPIDREGFRSFVQEVGQLLAAESAPESGSSCACCQYVSAWTKTEEGLAWREAATV